MQKKSSRMAFAALVASLPLAGCVSTGEAFDAVTPRLSQAPAATQIETATVAAQADAPVQIAATNQSLPAGATRVAYTGAHAAGEILVDHRRQLLYFIENGGRAIRYPIVVGKGGREISAGQFRIFERKVNPTYQEDEYDNGAMSRPGPRNPLGVRGLFLKNSRTGAYEGFLIHGTNDPAKFNVPDGQRVFSNGCLRMLNPHVTDLYNRVRVGTQVRIYFGDEIAAKVRPLGQQSAAAPVISYRFG